MMEYADGILITPLHLLSSDELAGIAEEDHDQSCGPNPDMPLDAFDWSFQPEFPLASLTGSHHEETRDEWIAWLKDEDRYYRKAHPDNADYYDEMETWWAKQAADGKSCMDPIIAAEDTDGKVYIWGGYHRTAISHKLRLSTVPVILGRIKQA